MSFLVLLEFCLHILFSQVERLLFFIFLCCLTYIGRLTTRWNAPTISRPLSDNISRLIEVDADVEVDDELMIMLIMLTLI